MQKLHDDVTTLKSNDHFHNAENPQEDDQLPQPCGSQQSPFQEQMIINYINVGQNLGFEHRFKDGEFWCQILLFLKVTLY